MHQIKESEARPPNPIRRDALMPSLPAVEPKKIHVIDKRCHHLSSNAGPTRAAFFVMIRIAWGGAGGVSPVSQLAGIVSLFFIAAAFLTSCNNPQPTQGFTNLSVLQAKD
jgi:hypothetical protein